MKIGISSWIILWKIVGNPVDKFTVWELSTDIHKRSTVVPQTAFEKKRRDWAFQGLSTKAQRL